jgi:D-aminoacyl-tRNA deacylase
MIGAQSEQYADRPTHLHSERRYFPVTIVSSTQDPASKNIAENLIEHHGFTRTNNKQIRVEADHGIRLVTLDKPCIFADVNDLPTDVTSIIFASKHVSSAKRPALTVHATGNLRSGAELGGKPEEVSFVDASIVHRALRGLVKGAVAEGLQIDVTMEATHHGPTSFHVPVCFVEVGSEPEEWNNPVLGRIAADSIMSGATGIERGNPAVGFGGTHYSAKLTKICFEGKYEIGHIVPRYAIEAGVKESVLRDAFRKTVGNCRTAIVDWKGLTGEDRRELVEDLESWGFRVERS